MIQQATGLCCPGQCGVATSVMAGLLSYTASQTRTIPVPDINLILLEGGTKNLDKLLIAVPLWFGMWAGNMYFAKKTFGTFLLPWNRASLTNDNAVLPLKSDAK